MNWRQKLNWANIPTIKVLNSLEDGQYFGTPYFHAVFMGPFALEGVSFKTKGEWDKEKQELHPECRIEYAGYDYGYAVRIFNSIKDSNEYNFEFL